MATVTRHVCAPIEDVFRALVTPETYPSWLMGAKEIRAVDENWPAVGSKFHHRVGVVGPLTIPDHSKVLEIDEPNLLTLEVRARPLGRGRAEFRLTREKGEGNGPRTGIALDEVPIGAISVMAPLLEPLIRSRNVASLNALVAFLNAPEQGSAKGAQADSNRAAASASRNV